MKKKQGINSAAVGFIDGFTHLFKGLKFAYVDHRELAGLYLFPMFLGVLFMIGGIVVFACISDTIVAWVLDEPDGWLLHFLWGLVRFFVWLVLAAATVVSSVFVFMLVAAPFSDAISEKVEGIRGTWEARPFSIRFLLNDLSHTLLLESVRLGIKLAWLTPLFILSLLIPGAGQVIYVIVGGYLLAKFFGMDYVDWALARRGYTWKERFVFARKNRPAILGFGLAVLLALMIPLGFVFIWPAAVAGGTILCTNLNPEDCNRKGGGAE